jgi:hypothetical protein
VAGWAMAPSVDQISGLSGSKPTRQVDMVS